MNLILNPIEKLIKSNNLYGLTSYDFNSMELVFDFSFGNDIFQISKDTNNKYLLHFGLEYYHKELYYKELSEKGYLENNFYFIDNIDECFEKVDVIIEDFFPELHSSFLGSDKWWSFLSNWMCLTPKLISSEYSNFIKKKLLEISNHISIDVDLNKNERDIYYKWLNYIEKSNADINQHSYI